ncbi:MAG TPA: hypothetical protein VGS08_03575 [Candidatus Saccharimonadales bacterium]|nr:hypothetical protein [Candidatus Saccharimonadales bacterium]
MKLYIYVVLPLLAALLALLFLTSPQDVTSVVLILPFAFIFSISFFGAYPVIRARGISHRARFGVATLLSALPTLLLILQSIGQLSLREAITIFAFFFIAYFYMVRSGVSVD